MVQTEKPDIVEKPSPPRSRRLLKWGSGGLIAFLAFAPPGTMIVIFLLAASVLGTSWVVVGALALIAIGIIAVMIVRRNRR